jgi:hypothetical protein
VSARCVTIALLFAVFGCSERQEPQAKPPAIEFAKPAHGPLAVDELVVDAQIMPRDGRPLIAGERVRLQLSVRGGQPPYQLGVRAHRADDPTGRTLGDLRPVELDGADGRPMELALAMTTSPDAISSDYQFALTLTDQAKNEVSLVSEPVEVVGSDAAPGVAEVDSRVTIVDAGGRQRKSFYRGEQITLRARLPDDAEVKIVLGDPLGNPFMEQVHKPDNGIVILPLGIPRTARLGTYAIAILSNKSADHGKLYDSSGAKGAFVVAGQPYEPLAKLTIATLTIYGGEDKRTVRAARLPLGETVRLEVLMGGSKGETVTTKGYVRDATGKTVASIEFPPLVIQNADPRVRAFVDATWQVPAELPPGSYSLQIDASEHQIDGPAPVSTRYRQLVLY